MIKIIEKKTRDLIPYENNPRINDEAVDAVANSIQQFGMKVPIVIDKAGVIINGHTRLKACQKLGIEKVPCVIADDLTDEQVKAFRIADNSTAQIAGWDLAKLEAELAGINMDMLQFGLQDQLDEIDALIEEAMEATDDGYEEPEDIEIRVHAGEIWQLGDHRLMCADSTDPANVAALMDGQQADLVITDPPYNVDYTGKTKDALKIQNDKMDDGNFFAFLHDAFAALDSALKPGGAFYIWHADSEGLNFRQAARSVGWPVKQCLIWNKNCMVMGRQDYQWKHEPCLYGWKEGAAHYFVDDRTQTTVFEDQAPDFSKMKKPELVALLEDIYSDKISTTIINEKKPARSELHPTMKPIKLISRQVKNSSKQGEIVLDTFGGSGSTLITCEQLHRACYTMELDEKYATVIVDRWEKFTGQKAVKVC